MAREKSSGQASAPKGNKREKRITEKRRFLNNSLTFFLDHLYLARSTNRASKNRLTKIKPVLIPFSGQISNDHSIALKADTFAADIIRQDYSPPFIVWFVRPSLKNKQMAIKDTICTKNAVNTGSGIKRTILLIVCCQTKDIAGDA